MWPPALSMSSAPVFALLDLPPLPSPPPHLFSSHPETFPGVWVMIIRMLGQKVTSWVRSPYSPVALTPYPPKTSKFVPRGPGESSTGSPAGAARFLRTLGLAVILCFRLRALERRLMSGTPGPEQCEALRWWTWRTAGHYFHLSLLLPCSKGLLPEPWGPRQLELPTNGAAERLNQQRCET